MFVFISLTASDIRAVVGQQSLIEIDPEEQRLQILLILPYADYDTTTKMNDLALIEVSLQIYQEFMSGRYFMTIRR